MYFSSAYKGTQQSRMLWVDSEPWHTAKSFWTHLYAITASFPIRESMDLVYKQALLVTAVVFLFVPVFRYRFVAAHSTGKHPCSVPQEEKGQDACLYTHLYLCGESECNKCRTPFLEKGKICHRCFSVLLLPPYFSNLCPFFRGK